MKKTAIITLLAVITFFISLPLIRAQRTRNAPPEPHHDLVIILDAGHGGRDGGASSRDGLVERDLVFAITTMVEKHLRLQGFPVILTRVDEHDLASPHANNRKREDLTRRIEIMNEHEFAIAISIHANAINNTSWRGAQTFYDPHALENKALAEAIMGRLRHHIPELTREARPISNIFILRNSTIPTALVEVGFLSNPAEANLLKDEDYQQLLAYSIFEGILTFIEAYMLD